MATTALARPTPPPEGTANIITTDPDAPPAADTDSPVGPGAGNGSRFARRAAGPLLGVATVAMGLIAGFFYAYACSVMIGLARVDDRTFVDTMQWINATVRNAGFAPSFFGALLVTGAAAAAQAGAGRRRPVVVWTLAGLALYIVAFVVTMGVSVPLNDELARAGDPDRITDLAAVRARYEGPWVAWNLVRTVVSTAAVACLARALVLHGRSGGAVRERWSLRRHR